MILEGLEGNEELGPRLKRDALIKPDVVTLTVLPDDQPVGHHVDGEALLKAGAQGAVRLVSLQKLACERNILPCVGSHQAREVLFAIPKVASAYVEQAGHPEASGRSLRDDVAFFLVFMDERGLGRDVQSFTRLS